MGEGLFQKIQECYRVLTGAWSPGSSVYLFGFSRGAYIARSLGCMIARFGLPTKNIDRPGGSTASSPPIASAIRRSRPR